VIQIQKKLKNVRAENLQMEDQSKQASPTGWKTMRKRFLSIYGGKAKGSGVLMRPLSTSITADLAKIARGNRMKLKNLKMPDPTTINSGSSALKEKLVKAKIRVKLAFKENAPTKDLNTQLDRVKLYTKKLNRQISRDEQRRKPVSARMLARLAHAKQTVAHAQRIQAASKITNAEITMDVIAPALPSPKSWETKQKSILNKRVSHLFSRTLAPRVRPGRWKKPRSPGYAQNLAVAVSQHAQRSAQRIVKTETKPVSFIGHGTRPKLPGVRHGKGSGNGSGGDVQMFSDI